MRLDEFIILSNRRNKKEQITLLLRIHIHFLTEEFAQFLKNPAVVEGDIVKYLEDTTEVEILSSDAGLILSVEYWEFVNPILGAADITMR